MTQTRRKPHSMAQNCAGCADRFRYEGDTLDEVLEAFRIWFEHHKNCGGEK